MSFLYCLEIAIVKYRHPEMFPFNSICILSSKSYYVYKNYVDKLKRGENNFVCFIIHNLWNIANLLLPIHFKAKFILCLYAISKLCQIKLKNCFLLGVLFEVRLITTILMSLACMSVSSAFWEICYLVHSRRNL